MRWFALGGLVLLLLIPLPSVVASPIGTPPTPPEKVTVATDGQGTTFIEWEPPLYNGSAPIEGYGIYLNESLLALVGPDQQSHTLIGPARGILTMTAFNEWGEGPASPPVLVGAGPSPMEMVDTSEVQDFVDQPFLPDYPPCPPFNNVVPPEFDPECLAP